MSATRDSEMLEMPRPVEISSKFWANNSWTDGTEAEPVISDYELADFLLEALSDRVETVPQGQHEEIIPVKRYDSNLSTVTSVSGDQVMTSMDVFVRFVKLVQGGDRGQLVVDASGILSKECFEMWLVTRQMKPSKPEECFRKSVISHVTCSDGGSLPFTPEVEKSLLSCLRTPKIWPCFVDRVDTKGKPVRIGIKGLRSLGYHERMFVEKDNAAQFNKRKLVFDEGDELRDAKKFCIEAV